MGASGWSYFAPYQRDAFAALEALRWKVFREGDYVKTSQVCLDFDAFIDGLHLHDDEHSLGMWEAWYAEVVEELREHVGSPDALRWHNGSEGTHSIIDIAKQSQLHELPSATVKQLFGTTNPTRDDVTRVDVIASAVGRNHCSHFTVYKDGAPSELFFFGFSGD